MALEITKQEQLEKFLVDKPAHWSQLIAARTALRVLPLALYKMPEQFWKHTLRACFMPWAAGRFPGYDPGRDMSESNRSTTYFVDLAARETSFHLTARETRHSITDPVASSAVYSAALSVACAAGSAFMSAGRASRSAALSAEYAVRSVGSAGWRSISIDVDRLTKRASGKASADLALSPFWSGETPPLITACWKSWTENEAASHYAPWINWYQSLLTGNGPSADYFGPELTLRIAQQPDKWWDRPAAFVNADISAWLAEAHENVVEIPQPEPGLVGTIDADGLVGFARSGEASADELAAVAGLLQVLMGTAEDLVALLAGNNSVAIAPGIAPQYLACLRAEPLSVDRLYALGVRLGNARGKLQRQIDSKDYPDLAPDVAEALDSVLELHGPVLLSTAEGRRLVDASSNYLQTAADNVALKRAATGYGKAVANSPDLFNKEARELLPQLNEDVGTGTHPERSTQVAMSASRNLLITVATVVLCETLKDGLAASVVGTSLTGVTAQTINFAFVFLTSNLPTIRELAAVSGPYLQWIEPLLRKAERRLRQPPLPPGQTGS